MQPAMRFVEPKFAEQPALPPAHGTEQCAFKPTFIDIDILLPKQRAK
jgi:hypothetical protein